MAFNHKQASEDIHKIHDTGVMRKFIDDDEQSDWHYVTQDSGAMLDLAAKNGINISYITKNDIPYQVRCGYWCEFGWVHIDETYAEHNGDKSEATRVAIARTAIDQSKEKAGR